MSPFTSDEKAEFKDWLEGQCSDGYGEGETVKATPEEVAYMMMREQRDPDFLSGHCDCIGESDFNVNWCPDELFGQGFVQL